MGKVPKLRFEGFEGDWEEKKISDRFIVTRGNVLATSKTGTAASNEKPYPVYSSQTKNNGLMGYYSEFLYENAITWTTDGANAGTVNYRDGKFFCTNVCGVLLSDRYANKMAAELLNTIAWRHVSRVGNPKLMNNVMSDIVLCLPETVEEQVKCSQFLERFDTLLTLHQRKHSALLKAKQFYLQNLFPRKGEKTPRLRFAGFSGEWKKKKLGDCCEIISKTVDPQCYPDTMYYEYSMPAFDNGMKPTKTTGSTMNSIRKIINKPCLLVNKLNVRKQRIWYIERPEENAVCSAEFVPLWSTRADLRFVKNVVLGKRFSQYLEECSSGSSNSQKRVTPDTIVDAIVELPEVAEQKAIGDYLSNLDHLITTQQRKLETLKRLKQFMLQNLFV